MAGSLNHIVGDDGKFTMDLIENMGDAKEALSECFDFIYLLTDAGKSRLVNEVARAFGFVELDRDMASAHGMAQPLPVAFRIEKFLAKKTLELKDYELAHLIAWHREQQLAEANKEEYAQATDHKKRREYLISASVARA